jgi:hypothetical protein
MRPHLNYMGMKAAADLAAEMENIVNNGLNTDKVMAMAKEVKEQCLISRQELEAVLETYH